MMLALTVGVAVQAQQKPNLPIHTKEKIPSINSPEDLETAFGIQSDTVYELTRFLKLFRVDKQEMITKLKEMHKVEDVIFLAFYHEDGTDKAIYVVYSQSSKYLDLKIAYTIVATLITPGNTGRATALGIQSTTSIGSFYLKL